MAVSTTSAVSRIGKMTDHLFDSGVQVLLDAFPVEDMAALRLDGVLGDVVA